MSLPPGPGWLRFVGYDDLLTVSMKLGCQTIKHCNSCWRFFKNMILQHKCFTSSTASKSHTFCYIMTELSVFFYQFSISISIPNDLRFECLNLVTELPNISIICFDTSLIRQMYKKDGSGCFFHQIDKI